MEERLWGAPPVTGRVDLLSPPCPGLRFLQPDLRASAGCGRAFPSPGWKPLGGEPLWVVGWAGAHVLG